MGNAELALDLCAETFAAALEASPRYEHRPEPARGWHIIKRIGRFATANHRTIPPPNSAPEMPLLRRAERDPSTPNPVSVVLSTGGPHTSFAVHFRVL